MWGLGSIYTIIMELGPKRPSPLWFWGPNSIIAVYMDPLGYNRVKGFHKGLSKEVDKDLLFGYIVPL